MKTIINSKWRLQKQGKLRDNSHIVEGRDKNTTIKVTTTEVKAGVVTTKVKAGTTTKDKHEMKEGRRETKNLKERFLKPEWYLKLFSMNHWSY